MFSNCKFVLFESFLGTYLFLIGKETSGHVAKLFYFKTVYLFVSKLTSPQYLRIIVMATYTRLNNNSNILSEFFLTTARFLSTDFLSPRLNLHFRDPKNDVTKKLNQRFFFLSIPFNLKLRGIITYVSRL